MRDFLLRRINHVFGNGSPQSESVRNTLIRSANEMEISLVFLSCCHIPMFLNKVASPAPLALPFLFSFQIYDDFLDDHLNADHAWVEAVCINFHAKDHASFHADAAKVRTFDLL